ncbi:MAG: 2-C-methyl-D-erythritol 4-phosphate cytidylyltransferase [Candidatus Kapaibacterium sp.]|nr:MAG: 2-C-methyl-D-erythritol 4-phosphate cytidylyltransferase [Candidatus Kapabacteria bacterium]
MNVGIVIPAAGNGQRFGGQLPKQYRVLCGVPVIIRALSAVRTAFPAASVVIACDGRWASHLEQVLTEYRANQAVAIVDGGSTRQESVRYALAHPSLASAELVVIHDAARPLATPSLAQRVTEAAQRSGAAIPVFQPKDTVKLLGGDGRTVESTVPRTRVGLAQTPQAFYRELLIEAHHEAYRDHFEGTDDASIVEYAGHPVTAIEGEETNIKITTPLDWAIAEHLVSTLNQA